MKNKSTISRNKKLTILSILAAFTKEHQKVNAACMFALTREKINATKLDAKSAGSGVIRFVKKVPDLMVEKNDITALNFTKNMAQYLIENSVGNVKMRDLEAIIDASNEAIDKLENTECDDSHKLINALK